MTAEDRRIAARAALKDLQRAVEAHDGDPIPLVSALGEKLTSLIADVPLQNRNATLTLRLTLSMPTSGFESPTGQRLVVGFGRGGALIFLGLAIFCSSVAAD